MSQFDSKKRNTLKKIAGTGAGIATGSIGLSAFANEQSSGDFVVNKQSSSQTPADLDITIIRSTPLGKINVVVRNNSSRALHIEKFDRDQIAMSKHHNFHLNRLLSNGPIDIAPHESKHYSVLTVAMGPTPYQRHLWETTSTRVPGKVDKVTRVQGMLSNPGLVATTLAPESISAYA